MNIIFWSMQENSLGKFEVMALKAINEEYAVNISDRPFEVKSFNNPYTGILWIKEHQKPLYYELYGANYELQFLDADSAEWIKLLDMWQKSIDRLETIVAPWYKKLWTKIKGAFSSSL